MLIEAANGNKQMLIALTSLKASEAKTASTRAFIRCVPDWDADTACAVNHTCAAGYLHA